MITLSKGAFSQETFVTFHIGKVITIIKKMIILFKLAKTNYSGSRLMLSV